MFNPAEKRDAHGRWTSAFRTVADRLEMEASKDGGPDRSRMPQLSGVPKPGSKADRMFPGRAPGTEVDLASEFEPWLNKRGIKVVDTEVPSSVLKPTQDQLIESKVIGIAKFMQHAPKNSSIFNPIYITADNHVIDGHHRWAGNEVRNEVEGVPRWMKVRQVQADKDTSLRLATQFMDEYGLPRAGVDDKSGAVSKFASLSTTYRLKEVDLAYNPLEKRDGHGKWTKGGASHGVKWPANPKTTNLNGKDMSISRAVTMVGRAYSWSERDKEGSVAADHPSIIEQDKAQIAAKTWATRTDAISMTASSPTAEMYAAALWQEYQSPQEYGLINGTLRGQHKPGAGEPSAADLKKYTDKMFEKGGWTTERPMTVYRALKSSVLSSEPNQFGGKHDWGKELKPGTVFTDKGIVSTTAHSKFAVGWLEGNATGDQERIMSPGDAVVEIHLPAGQRIVGGDPQFIETMLPPGTSLRIVSSTVRHGPGRSPITNAVENVQYHHIVAEVVQ